MIKLKFSLDPADRNQMLALSRFAGTLAGAGVEIEAFEPKSLKLAARVEEADKLEAMAKGMPEPKQEAAPASTRKRRTKAEIEAERAAANTEIPEEDEDPEAENEEAEEVEEVTEEAEETAPAGRSTAERGGKKITMDDVRAAVAEKKDKHFDKMKRELLNRYGVATTPKLPEEHWAAFYDFVNGLD